MEKITFRLREDVKEFLEQLREEKNHDSISAVIRELIFDAYNIRRTEQYLKGMEQRIISKIDHLAELADL